MRNWNLDLWETSAAPKQGFYSTYEELKRAPVAAVAPPTIGFYSTYEELKQSFE